MFLDFVTTVLKSPLLCTSCKQGLFSRYLISRESFGLEENLFKSGLQLDRQIHWMFWKHLALAKDGIPVRRVDFHPGGLDEPASAVVWKQWDCADADRWGKLYLWLKVISRTESITSRLSPLTSLLVRSSAWRSRVWIATAGRYTLDDFKNGRSIARFLTDHEQYMLECFLWPAASKVPEDQKYLVTPADCDCSSLDGSQMAFRDVAMKLGQRPEILQTGKATSWWRAEIVASLIEKGFDPEISLLFLTYPLSFRLLNHGSSSIPEYEDPFDAFRNHWNSSEVQQELRLLTMNRRIPEVDSPAYHSVK